MNEIPISHTPSQPSRSIYTMLVVAFVATRCFVVGLGILSIEYLPMMEGGGRHHLQDAPPALDMWNRWDAGYYSSIAIQGYGWFHRHEASPEIVFLPLYPMLIRATTYVIGCSDWTCNSNDVLGCLPRTCAIISGLIISNAALLGAIMLLYRYTRTYAGHSLAMLSVWLLLLSPNNIFFSGVYTESLFLLLAIGVLYALYRERFWLAVTLAGVASLTRTMGLALYFPLILYVLSQRGALPPFQLAARLLFAHVPLIAFGAYVLYAGYYAGDWLAYFHANAQAWNRSVGGGPIAAFAQYFYEPIRFWEGAPGILDLLFTLFYFYLTYWVIKREDRSQAAYSVAGILIPVSSGLLFSMPRYGSVVFPFYLALARKLDRPVVRVIVLSLSILANAIFTIRVSTWHLIA